MSLVGFVLLLTSMCRSSLIAKVLVAYVYVTLLLELVRRALASLTPLLLD